MADASIANLEPNMRAFAAASTKFVQSSDLGTLAELQSILSAIQESRVPDESAAGHSQAETAKETPMKTSILDLPAELRNHIYALAVTQEDPIIAYVEHSVARRDEDERERDHCGLVQWVRYAYHRRVARPSPPALARVCKQIRKEVRPIYLAENSFLFTLGLAFRSSIQQWSDHWPIAVIGDGHLRSVVLEFKYAPLPALLGVVTCVWEAHGQLNINKSEDGSIAISTGGGFAHECSCYLEELATAYNADSRFDRSWRRGRLIAFANLFENVIFPGIGVGRQWDGSYIDSRLRKESVCTNCGKPRGELELDEIPEDLQAEGINVRKTAQPSPPRLSPEQCAALDAQTSQAGEGNAPREVDSGKGELQLAGSVDAEDEGDVDIVDGAEKGAEVDVGKDAETEVQECA